MGRICRKSPVVRPMLRIAPAQCRSWGRRCALDCVCPTAPAMRPMTPMVCVGWRASTSELRRLGRSPPGGVIRSMTRRLRAAATTPRFSAGTTYSGAPAIVPRTAGSGLPRFLICRAPTCIPWPNCSTPIFSRRAPGRGARWGNPTPIRIRPMERPISITCLIKRSGMDTFSPRCRAAAARYRRHCPIDAWFTTARAAARRTQQRFGITTRLRPTCSSKGRLISTRPRFQPGRHCLPR